MRHLSACAAAVGILAVVIAAHHSIAQAPSRQSNPPTSTNRPVISPVSYTHPSRASRRKEIPAEELTAVVRRVCGMCHNEGTLAGNLNLTTFDVALATQRPEVAEKMIVKLRAGMMPPPGIPRPGGDTLLALVETLERTMDQAAAGAPNPGNRPFQRLNRAEYERSIAELLDLEISAGDYLPLDTKSANFDNIADVQMLSPTLLGAYLNAADQISRLALGDRSATAEAKTYEKPGYFSQWDQEQGAPFGTRGGITVV